MNSSAVKGIRSVSHAGREVPDLIAPNPVATPRYDLVK
jgi:hypothetical protein